jgi:predicted RNase H-like nuclease (RuvC/YqgF family)
VKPYIAKIEAMQREHYSELKDKDRSIKELQSQNGKVNQKLIDANREIDQLKKALERYQRKNSTFKMDEVAKITKKHERPAHLRR